MSASCDAGTAPESDFNGDGIRDVVIADAEATVEGKAEAGLVHVIHGGGKGTYDISQASQDVADSPEEGDRFGFSIAVYDADSDGCSDLAVGIPHEDVGTTRDAGYVQIVFGAPEGLGKGRLSKGFLQGTGLGGGYETDDWLGYAVAGGRSATGIPFLVVGAPGEDGAAGADAGIVHYVAGSAFTSVSDVDQDSTGVWETAEPYDRFGASLAATTRHFVVGIPGESIGDVQAAGGVQVFVPSINNYGIPDPVWGLGQHSGTSADADAEAGDRFGTSVAIAPYRPSGKEGPVDSMLAVGIPGEDIGAILNAGAVGLFLVNSDKTLTRVQDVATQGSGGSGIESEAGDHYGQTVALANTDPSEVVSADTVRLAVGVPGKDSADGPLDVGGVQLLALCCESVEPVTWLAPGNGIPSAAAERQYAGLSVNSSTAALYVGMPYGPMEGRAVYAFPWTAVTGSEPTETWRPGEGGLPAETWSFGTNVR